MNTRLEISVDEATLQALKRIQELLAQKTGEPASLASAIKASAEEFVNRHDPVTKADRSTQSALHAVARRDRGTCQFQMPGGKKCGARQWLHHHHIKPKAQGGSDDPENLITLCAAHHRQVHAH